jgi:hypothetical protein
MKYIAILLTLGSLLKRTQQLLIYNHTLGLRGLYYSAASYCAYDTLENWECGKPCKENAALEDIIEIINPKRYTFAYAGFDPSMNEIVLAFRGTANND